jgi:RND superfamily putative drug exporter
MRRLLIIGVWLLLTALAAPLALKLTDVQDNGALLALPAGAEAVRATARAQSAFPGAGDQVAVAVYARDSGLTDADRAKVEADRAHFAAHARDGRVPPAAPSPDGQALLLTFPLGGDADAQAAAAGEVKRRLAQDVPAGLATGLTGSAGAGSDVFDAFDGMDGTLLLVTAAAVTLLLLVAYRSPVLWLVPLVAVGMASQVASAAVYLLARYAGLVVDLQSQSILTILVFGVGVDYALLLIARYREELHQHADRRAAMALALRRSFPAVAASAATVAAALLCLLAADLPGTRGLGPVAAVGVLAALAAMTTLLPALLVVCGRWLFWPFVPRPDGAATLAQHGGWSRVAAFVGRRPAAVWIGSALALAALSLGATNLSVGIPLAEMFTKEVGSVTGQRLVARHYPGGSSAPAEVYAAAGAGDAVAAAARGVAGVVEVAAPQPSPDGWWVRVRAVLADAPDTEAAARTVQRLRSAVHAVPGADALVGGEAATELDAERAATRDNWVLMPLVLVVVLVILVGLLRAVVAPLLLVASVVLSYAAAMGAAGLILVLLDRPNLFHGLPLQAFLFLVALGVDYTIFLMTRAREEVAAAGHRVGVLRALTVTGGVVTSAGLVLAATFAALAVLPLVPSVQIGIVVAVGILLDTFVVRSLLVPALALHVGPVVWWPGRVAALAPPAPATEPVPVP